MSDQIHEAVPGGEPAQPDNVWASLRQAREARGLSLHQVSAHLKLTVRQIEAIERGDLSVLPGATFARGFVRNYARFLGLDPLLFLEAESPELKAPAELPARMVTPSLGRMPSPGNPRYSALPAGALVVLVALLLGAGWHYGWFEAREELALLDEATVQVSAPVEPEAEVSAPSVDASAPVAGAAASEPVAPASPVPAAAVATAQSAASATASAPAGRPLAQQSAVVVTPQSVSSAPMAGAPAGLPRLSLSFEGESWVEVRDASGKIVFSRLNQAGSVQEVQGTPPFDLVIGNAPKVRLSWKNRAVDLAPLTKGEVARVNLQ